MSKRKQAMQTRIAIGATILLLAAVLWVLATSFGTR